MILIRIKVRQAAFSPLSTIDNRPIPSVIYMTLSPPYLKSSLVAVLIL